MLHTAKDEISLVVVEIVQHGLFLRSNNGWIRDEILRFKNEGGNWFLFDAAIKGPAVVCGNRTFIVTGASAATVVVISESAISFFSVQEFHSCVRILQERLVVAFPRLFDCSSRGW